MIKSAKPIAVAVVLIMTGFSLRVNLFTHKAEAIGSAMILVGLVICANLLYDLSTKK